MATNFPSSQDNFTNPTSSDTLDSPDHASQHTNVNDAVEAIELALLDGAPLHIDDTNERVGIGVTNPSSILEVGDPLAARLILDDQGGTVGTNTHSKVEFQASGTRAGHVGFNNTSTGIMGLVNADGEVRLQTDNANQILLRTNNSTRVTVTGTGDVGINDTTPSYKLDVNGDIRTTGSFYINNVVQGEWVSFTPVPLDYSSPAYTASNAGTTSHSIGTSNFYYSASLSGYYHVSNNQCRVRYYGAYASGNLTNTPYYSLPFLPDTTALSQVPYFGWGRMQVFMGGSYLLRPQIKVVNTGSARRHVNGEVEVKQYPSTTFNATNFFINTQFSSSYGNNPNSFTSGHTYMEIVYTI